MISTVFNAFIYTPLYNGIVLLIKILPWADLGVIVIVFTIIVRLLLFPLSQKSVKTQMSVKLLEPEVNKIKEEFKDNKQEQSVKIMELYKKRGVNPFSSFFLVFVQIPIIFALYFIFVRGGFPVVNEAILYDFNSLPGDINATFLGLLDVTQKSILLSLLTGITQYLQVKLSSALPSPSKDKKQSFANDLAKGMQIQMKYVLPVVVAFISYSLSSMIAIYWITSNIFTIGQEMYVKKTIREPMEKEV